VSIPDFRQASALMAITCVIALLAAHPPAAEAKPCGSISANGSTWIVGGAGAGCKFQRKWARRYLEDRRVPEGWKCHFRSGSGGCDERGSDAFFVFYPPD
jgi:hypothetical protein